MLCLAFHQLPAPKAVENLIIIIKNVAWKIMSRDGKNTKIMFADAVKTVGLSLLPGEEKRGEARKTWLSV